MNNQIKILHLEDTPSDADLVRRALKKGSLDAEILVVEDKPDFIKAINDFHPDIILSDHSLPTFNSHQALITYKEMGLQKQIPFILITATISEEFAVLIMKEGACDYILKDRMERLPNAVLGALEKYRVESERQKYLEEVISNATLMKEAQNMAKFGSWQINLINKTADWSDEVYRILNYTPGQVSPSVENFLQQIHPKDLQRITEAIDRAISNRDEIKLDFEIQNQEGPAKYCHLELALQSGIDNSPIKIIGFIQDITKIRVAENEVKLLNESLERKVEERTVQLQEANKELEAFNYSISHDMRSPLQIINGFSSILLSKYNEHLNEEVTELLQHIKIQTSQMRDLIDCLLNFSRSGRQTLSKMNVNMSDIVDTVLKELKNVFPAGNAEVSLHHLDNAYCDKNLIKQVWVNLISNAIKYSSKKDHPVVEVGSKHINDELVYYVKDNGAGFNMEYSHKLFGAFNRLHDRSQFEGSGIGLAIVYRIIKRHGGRIWADAKVGEGATFYFTV
jgi:signal transduction histidine kinase/FixJ family two-component response regulator